jgi:transposase
MTKKKARQFTPEQKVAILREHLIDRASVSDVCDKHQLRPTVLYRWQKQFFEQGAAAFRSARSEEARVVRLQQRVAQLEQKLQVKNEVLSELMEEHILLKKKNGAY